MSQIPLARKPRRPRPAESAAADDGPLLDLDRYVPAFITFIANKLSNSATAHYQRHFGVSVTEWRIMSLLVNQLQKRGLVAIRTAPDDGRSNAISLTPRGRAIHDKVIIAALERERRLLSCLKKDEREVLIDLLRRLHENLGAVTGQCST